MKDVIERVQAASNIFIPKGEDREPCTAAFQELSGIEVPAFSGEDLRSRSQGRTFWLFKGMDIPALVGSTEGVGIAGTDSVAENRFRRQVAPVLARRIGEPMCRFSVLAEQDRIDAAESVLNTDPRYAVAGLAIPTSRPKLLADLCSWRDIGFVPLQLQLRGSIEAMARLTGIGIAADLVRTGTTARDNKLEEVSPLCDVYPEIVLRAENASL